MSQSKRRPRPRKKQPVNPSRVCFSIQEWTDATGISVPTTYRMMADGRLHYVQLTDDMRKIPAIELVRLGLCPA